jgi:hypothetical protein
LFEKEGGLTRIDTTFQNLPSSLSKYDPISLQDMSDVALMKRMDTKFVMRSRDLGMLLDAVEQDYHILEIDGLRSHSYASLYFDTPSYKFYVDHHNRKLRRSKVRMRKYLDSNLSFFEIKQKDPKGETSKSRIRIADLDHNLLKANMGFVHDVLDQNIHLHPTISNSFDRITLVHKGQRERVTIDRDIQFVYKDQQHKLQGVSVVEIKQERINRDSTIHRSLKKINLRPMRISKYCIGMVSLYPEIKYNRFKQKILHLNKIN